MRIRIKKFMTIAITFALLLSVIMPNGIQVKAAPKSYTDIKGHNYEEALLYVTQNSLMINSGKQILPDQTLTKGAASMSLNYLLGAKETYDMSTVKNLNTGDKYYNTVAVGLNAGYLVHQENGNVYNPLAKATYKYIVDIFSNALGINMKDAVMNVFPTKMLSDKLTRGEFAHILASLAHNILSNDIKNKALEGDVYVVSPNLYLTNLDIKGNLIIADVVADQEVTLNNVRISGSLIIRGGGENSVVINNSVKDNIPNVVIKTPNHNMKLKTDKVSTLSKVEIMEGSKGVSVAANVANLIINNKNASVTTSGINIDSIIINENAEVSFEKATIGSIEINGNDVKLIVNSDSMVNNVNVNANKVVISGNGIVKNVKVTERAKDGVEVLTVPTKVTVDTNAGAVKTKNNGMIQPGKTVTTSNLSNSSESWYTPSNSSTPDVSTGLADEELKIDDDNDGIPDYIEKLLGLDTTKDDTDGDGLSDSFEFSYLTTNLLIVDTDSNGISDYDEDEDNDGLKNGSEQELGTRPDSDDTDGDGIKDGEEVTIYNTIPLLEDTDGDTLTDSEEIRIGLDPTKVKTDDITNDNLRTFTQVANDEIKDDALLISGNWLTPSVSGNVAGDISRNVLLEESDNDAFDDNRSVLSDVIDVSTSYSDPITLSFSYNTEYTGENKALTIVSFDDVNGLQIIDTTIDELNKKISGDITGSGTYFVIDLDEFLKGFGIDVFSNIQKNFEPAQIALDGDLSLFPTFGNSSVYDENETITPKADEYSDIGIKLNKTVDIDENGNTVEVYSDENGNVIDTKVIPVSVAFNTVSATETFATSFAGGSSATGKADIVFVLDVTGSMDDDIRNVASNINAFVDSLVTNYNIDANFGLVTYDDYVIPPTDRYGTRVHKNMSSTLFTNANTFKNKMNEVANNYNFFWGGQEVVLDGLGMSIAESGDKIDWRNDSAKFVVLLTDEAGDMRNRYGYSSISDIAATFANKGICVSVITEPYLFSNYNKYNLLWETTNGLFANIRTDFSTVLLGLADKVGEVTNQGEWVFLSDFQAIRLAAEDAENYGDTDKDGLGDYAELGTPIELDMLPYINQLKAKGGYAPEDIYTGKTKITVYQYLSNPVLPDTDFDGMNDNNSQDLIKRNNGSNDGNKFSGRLTANDYTFDVEFTVDYRDFFTSETAFKDSLSILGSLYSTVVYHNNVSISSGTNFTGSIKSMFELFGLKDVEVYHLNSNYRDDDISEIAIGHRLVEYKGIKKEIIVVAVRGTNGTIEEWSSNFDVGADISNYWDRGNSFWRNKNNHKGFDVAANRIYDYIISYVNSKVDSSAQKAIYITGHSRGAAIANILGAKFESLNGYESFTYTFATPNTTTSPGNYRTIYNIVNTDDLIPMMPLSAWGFSKYGTTRSISVSEKYEDKNPFGDKVGTFEWLFGGTDYNDDGGTSRTIGAFQKLADNRDAIYKYTCSCHGDSSSDDNMQTHNIVYYFDVANANEAKNDLLNSYTARINHFVSVTVEDSPMLGIHRYSVVSHQTPAFFMMTLADLAVHKDPIKYNVAPKYQGAKASFLASAIEKAHIGGLTHPHMPGTYYLIARNKMKSL